MTAPDDTDDTDEPTTTDDPAAPATDDRLAPMQPRHGPRPRRTT